MTPEEIAEKFKRIAENLGGSLVGHTRIGDKFVIGPTDYEKGDLGLKFTFSELFCQEPEEVLLEHVKRSRDSSVKWLIAHPKASI